MRLSRFAIPFACFSAHLTVAPFITAFRTFKLVKKTENLGSESNTISAPGRLSASYLPLIKIKQDACGHQKHAVSRAFDVRIPVRIENGSGDRRCSVVFRKQPCANINDVRKVKVVPPNRPVVDAANVVSSPRRHPRSMGVDALQ